MESHPKKFTFKLKKENKERITESSFSHHTNNGLSKSIDSSSSGGVNKFDDVDHDDNEDYESSQNQLVVYDNETNGDIVKPSTDPHYPGPVTPYQPSRGLPSVGAFTVQCSLCFKWRLIPTKEKYEKIREHITEQPFICENALEWKPDISCDDPPDISQDGSRIWAIDKPNIARPPVGWEREIRIRGEGSSKFADVYYVSPSSKRLRSMVDVQKYLLNHPEYEGQGVTLTQFSFQTPKPLQENYVRKRPRLTACTSTGLPKQETDEASPPSLLLHGPTEFSELQHSSTGLSNSPFKPTNDSTD